MLQMSNAKKFPYSWVNKVMILFTVTNIMILFTVNNTMIFITMSNIRILLRLIAHITKVISRLWSIGKLGVTLNKITIVKQRNLNRLQKLTKDRSAPPETDVIYDPIQRDCDHFQDTHDMFQFRKKSYSYLCPQKESFLSKCNFFRTTEMWHARSCYVHKRSRC